MIYDTPVSRPQIFSITKYGRNSDTLFPHGDSERDTTDQLLGSIDDIIAVDTELV